MVFDKRVLHMLEQTIRYPPHNANYLDTVLNCTLDIANGLVEILIAGIAGNVLAEGADKSETGSIVRASIFVVVSPVVGVLATVDNIIEDPVVNVATVNAARTVARLEVDHHSGELGE